MLGKLWSKALGFSTLHLFHLGFVCYLQYKFPFLFLLAVGRNFSTSLTHCFLEKKEYVSLKAKKSVRFNGL